MKKSSFLSLFALTIVLGIGSGCVKKPDDAKMSSDIQNKFSQDSGLSNKQLTVQANDGVVTLSGTVENDAQRDAAGKQAASVPGVKTVVNNLEVAPSALSRASEPPPPSRIEAAPAKPQPGNAGKSSKAHKSKSARHSSNNSEADQSAENNQSSPPPVSSAAPASQNSMASTPATPPPPPPAPKKYTIDQGTQLSIRLVDPIDSEKNQTGDTFHATLNTPLTSDGEEAVPAGVDVTGHLVEVKSAGKFAGQSAVALQLDSLTSGGKTYNLHTDQYRKQGSSRGKNTAEKVGGGAAIGAIIGALAGGGKGAAIGAAAGGGVGGGVQAATKSQQIKLPSETVLSFTLQAPITVVQVQGSQSNRQKLNN